MSETLSWIRTVDRMGQPNWFTRHHEKDYRVYAKLQGNRLCGRLFEQKTQIAFEVVEELDLLPFQDPNWSELELTYVNKLIRWAEGYILTPMELLSQVLS